ncbi:MAG: hypothetical protein DVB23_003321 [Verrucomicrobia bacterium]|jgi:hypothetical protein|nr:MAG: hypothetical protein DVB23_003321 [Verrucomicrobiota bacterium]
MSPLISWLQEHWPEALASVASLFIGSLIGRWRAWKRFADRSFFDRVTVSLNYVAEGRFLIRTLLERSAMEIFRNAEMARAVQQACAKPGKDPLLALPEESYWYYLNPILNAISELFADGFIRSESGAGGTEQTYLLFLTCENEAGATIRQRKVRVMMIREQTLLDSATLTPIFRNPFQAARWETLRKVREELVTNPGTPRIRKITVCV